MSNSDSIKTVLINEIEENLNQTANSANSMFKTKVIDVRNVKIDLLEPIYLFIGSILS